MEFCEFASNGNTSANPASPTHNIYIYGGTFAMRYSYLHDPTQGQNLHCRAVSSVIEYNWFDRAKSYVGDLMTSDDYANNPVGTDSQSMTLLGNVIIESPNQANTGQIIAMFNDEAVGSPVTPLGDRALQHGHRRGRTRELHPRVERRRDEDDGHRRQQHHLRDEPALSSRRHDERLGQRQEQLGTDGRHYDGPRRRRRSHGVDHRREPWLRQRGER